MAVPPVIPLARWLPASHTAPAGPNLSPECHGRAYFGIGTSPAQQTVVGMTATQQAIGNNLPPATALGPCSMPNRTICGEHHPRFNRLGGFWVCDDCDRHSRRMLGLDAAPPPAGTEAPHHFADLGFVGPPSAPNNWVPGTGWWHVGTEFNDGIVTRPRPFAEFMTRVCDPCERTVQHAINAMTASTIPACATAEQRGFWEIAGTFRHTCTCKKKLGIMGIGVGVRRILCKKDRDQIWTELLAKRDANENFLRNMQKGNNPATQTGKWRRATDLTLRDRVNSPGWYRGCKVSSIAPDNMNGD